MSFLAGRTELGRRLNKITVKSEGQEVGKFKMAKGIILRPFKDVYTFYISLLSPQGKVIIEEAGPIRLAGVDTQLALMYGPPGNLSRGQGEAWEVIIFYTGSTVNNGVAIISRKLYETSDGYFEAVKTSNELIAKGTAWAPPGSGLV